MNGFAGKTVSLITVSAAMCFAAAAFGQGGGTPAAPPPQPSGSNAQAGMVAPTGGLFESSTFLQMSDRIFNPDSDSLDFESGSFNWKGKTFNLTESRAFRARFERFLLSAPSQDEQEYAALIEEILDRLSVRRFNSEDELFATWELLFQASRFDADAGNSLIVANQVFNAWRVQKETRGIELTQKELRVARTTQQEIVANRTLIAGKLAEKAARESTMARESSQQGDEGGKGKKGGRNNSTASPSGMDEAAFRALELAETEAQIAALEVQSVATAAQAKIQFQSQIVTFILQRRFQHAIMLSGFYRMIFKGSHQQLEVGDAAVSEFFPESDLTYTVDTMEFLAREAVNDVKGGAMAVDTAIEEGNLIMALERLQETFFLGEYLTVMTSFPAENRRTLLTLYRKMIEAGDIADAQDYDAVEEIVLELDQLTKDFPKNQILASIERARSASDMAVFAAAQYRNLGDIDKARDELEKAVKLWPSNPALRDFRDETNKLTMASANGERVFDDLYKRGDWRGIYERKNELGLALVENEQLLPLLQEVVERIAQIDVAIAQSEEMVRGENAYAGWEILATASKLDAEDPRLNKARADLAPRVADFVQVLDQAERSESNGKHAAALVAYLRAQDIYPASGLSRTGIERQSAMIMADMQPDLGE